MGLASRVNTRHSGSGSKGARLIGWLLLFGVVAFSIWYIIAADYSYSAVSGTYVYRSDQEASTLILKSDQSFDQELMHDGVATNAHGTWRRIGEGRVVFSKEFLKMPRQDIRPDGQADGEVRKRLGVFLSLALDPASNGPIFRKKMFR
jgi:hypothetical protein